MSWDDASKPERQLRIAVAMTCKWIVSCGIQDRVFPALEHLTKSARDEEERGAIRLVYAGLLAAQRELAG